MANRNMIVMNQVAASSHAAFCKHHDDPKSGLCHAVTKAGINCTHRSRQTQAGILPKCRVHASSGEKHAGNCQAIEECGQPCNRVAPYNAPFHLCSKHQGGTDTLPCHFLRLPTELRLMVFRYIFPAEIPHRHIPKVSPAILKVNRVINQEASSVLYGESTFHVNIDCEKISMQNKVWSRKGPISTTEAPDALPLAETIFKGANLIQTLSITIFWSSSATGAFFTKYGVSREEYKLYETRDSVRKLVDFLMSRPKSSGSPGTLKRLSICVEMSYRGHMPLDERVAAISAFVDPFQDIRVVDQVHLEDPKEVLNSQRKASFSDLNDDDLYAQFRENWITAVKAEKPATLPADVMEAKAIYSQIEVCVHLILWGNPNQNGMTNKVFPIHDFPGICRLLHIGRLACDNGDLETIDHMRKILVVLCAGHECPWKDDDTCAVSRAVHRFFDSVASATPSEPNDQVLYDIESIRPYPDPMPKLGEPGVTVEEDGQRMYAYKDGKKWVRLKTPESIRMVKWELHAAELWRSVMGNSRQYPLRLAQQS
ncbi:Retinal domain containing protein [Pyrenophora teres f. maculata]|nr:Retinal domain containing protein [Pyrenophora teres f. maculata]